MNYLHEIIADATTGQREAIAIHFDLNPSTVYKWCEDPNGSGHPIPANRIVPLCEFLNDWRIVEFLAMQSGRVLFELPKAAKSKENIDRIMEVASEFSDLLKAAVKASEDDIITILEFERIEKEAFELHAATVGAVEHFRELRKEG